MSSVDPVVRLLADLDRPARPTVEFRDALLARLLGELEEAIRRELEAQATARSSGWGARVLHAVRRRPGRTMLAFAAVAGAAAAALFISTPWTTSPGFLERAQAALTPPAGTILHYRSEATMTSTDPACTVRRGPHEFWIDQTPPHRFRALLNDLPKTQGPIRARSSARPGSGGGRRHARRHPGADARIRAAEQAARLADEVPHARRTLCHSFARRSATEARTTRARRSRRAHGRAHPHRSRVHQVERRRVQRLCPFPDCPPKPTYVYVDPETFYPVEVRSPYAVGLVNGPVLWHDLVVHYDTYEFLPRTDANLALTDIRAQHPDATGP